MRPKLVIWGAAGHARVVADIVRLVDEYELVGFIDDSNRARHGDQLSGKPVLGGREVLSTARTNGITHAIIAVGDCAARLQLAEVVQTCGLELATAVHPSAVIAQDGVLGQGTVVAAGAVLNPGAVLGANTIVNTLASVDHDCAVHDGAHLSPGVHLGGNAVIGRSTWVGIGATISNTVHVGAASIIGAGAVVVRDIPDGVVAYGVPARVQGRISQ